LTGTLIIGTAFEEVQSTTVVKTMASVESRESYLEVGRTGYEDDLVWRYF